MIVKGKITHIVNPLLVVVEAHLPLDIRMTRNVWLSGVLPARDKEDIKRFTRCAVILLGGKMVYLDLPLTETHGRIQTTLYLDVGAFTENFNGFLSDVSIDGGTKSLLCVNNYLNHLASLGYDAEEYKSRVSKKNKVTAND